MKRAFLQKVKPVSSDAVDKEELQNFSAYRVGLFRQALPEGNRRARTSAAMIGLAISMGASSLFLPRQGDGAMGAEPTAASPTVPTALASLENGDLDLSAVVESAPAATLAPMPSVLLPQSVQEPTQWQHKGTEQVDATALAPDNGIRSEFVIETEAELYVPSHPSNRANFEAIAPWKQPIQNEALKASPSTLLAPLAAPVAYSLEDVTLTDDVNRVFDGKQQAAIKKMQPLSNRFRNGLAEFGSEESLSSSKSVTELAVPYTVGNPSKNIIHPSAEAAFDGIETLVTEPDAIAQRRTASWLVIGGDRPSAITPEGLEAPAIAPSASPEAATGQVQPDFTLERLDAPAITTPLGIPVPSSAAPDGATGQVQPDFTLERLEAPAIAPLGTPTKEAAAPDGATGQVPLKTNPEGVEAPAIAPLGIVAPKAASAPETVEDPASPTQTSFEVVTPDLSQAVVINPEATQTAIGNIYRVNSGDTLGAIAQNYGLSSTDLVKANKLSDPNSLAIDQTLTIPLYQPGRQEVQTTALIDNPQGSGSVATPNLLALQSTPQMQVPSLVLPQPTLTASTPTISLVPPATSSDSTSSETISRATEMEESAKGTVEALPYAPSTANVPDPLQSPNLQPETEYNPSGEGLRAEILKLREKYRTQKASTGASNGTGSPMPSPADAIAPQSNLSMQARQVNPEFSPNRYTQTGQAEIQNSQQLRALQLQSQTAASTPVEIPVPEQALDESRSQQSVMATAPLGSVNYEPLQPRMVSPELPPLSSPDTYLPKGGATFAGFIWPAQGELTSGYGWRWGRMHKGIDVAGPIGTPVVAAAPGKITYAQWNEGGYGNLVEVTHPDGSVTLYAHNDRILVREGQEVDQGQQIAEMGSTGFSTGPHLHFELHARGQGAVNPIAYLPGSEGASSDL